MTDPRITKELIEAGLRAMEDARWPEGVWTGGSSEPPETDASIWMQATLEAVFALLPEPGWEWEYAVDDDPEGSVYGRFRRLVGPWERDPLPDTNEGETR